MEPKPDKPTPTPHCCDVWRQTLGVFRWMVFSDFPDLYSLPHIICEGVKYKVNHCPSCGASRVGVVVTADNLMMSETACRKH